MNKEEILTSLPPSSIHGRKGRRKKSPSFPLLLLLPPSSSFLLLLILALLKERAAAEAAGGHSSLPFLPFLPLLDQGIPWREGEESGASRVWVSPNGVNRF